MVQKYDKTLLKTAELFAQESSCLRKKVGAVISDSSRPISVGYNGTLPGSKEPCEDQNETSPHVIHAEQNAISFAAKSGISTNNTTLYVTLSPCNICALLIVQAGIKKVVYREEYRDTTGLEILKGANIELLHLMD